MDEEGEAMDTGRTNQPQVEKRANRIMKIFSQITECLEKQEVARIKGMLTKIINLCKNEHEKHEKELNEIYEEYLLMVEFRAGISVNLIKLSVESFLMIEEDSEVLGKKVNDMFLEMIIREHPTLAMDMNLSDELLHTYFRLLNEGSEPALHMRLMVVGMFGVGKTSLVRRLCSQDIKDVDSTEGIDIFTETLEVNEDESDWIISPDEQKERIFNLRLQRLIEKYKKDEEKQSVPETRNDREPITTDKPQNTQVEAVYPIVKQIVERKVDFEEFRVKVDEKDLRRRTDVQTTEEVIRRPTISLWDFAGQSAYYSTHHFFLNDRSIYILVLNLSKELDSFVEEDSKKIYLPNFNIGSKTGLTCLEAFKFWMKSIYIYTKQKNINLSTAGRPEYQPKIVLIGTHKDAITPEQLNDRSHEKYKNDYFDRALKSFVGRPIADLVHPKKFLVNNKSTSAEEILEFSEVKREIFKIAKENTPFLYEEIPAKFLPLERAVFKNKMEKKKLMRFEDLQQENKTLEFPSSKSDIQLFLAFQHAFGNVIYFNAETLHDTVILTPQWIINVLKAFVTHKSDKGVSAAWYDLEERGILWEKLIDKMLENHTELYQRKDHIVKFMERMDFFVKPFNFQSKITQGGRETHQNNPNISQTNDEFYIMPCMLPRIPKLKELKECYRLAHGESNSTTLCLYFKECFLPPFVTHCLLASFIKIMKIRTLKGKRMLYNELGSFSFEDRADRYLTIWSFDDILHIKISFIDKPDPKDRIQFCTKWRQIIERHVLDIFNFHGKNVYTRDNALTLFEHRIKCPKCEEQMPCEQRFDDKGQPYDYMDGLFSVSDLRLRKNEMRKCSCCGNSTPAIEILEDWFELEQVIEDVDMNEKCLFELPQDDRLADLSDEIPKKKIRELASQLCINDREIERLEDGTPEVCFNYRVLHLWKKRGETWHTLYGAILKARIDIKDEDFFRIIKGEESEDVLKRFKGTMKQLENILTTINLDENMLIDLAKCIGEDFWLLGLRLGVKDRDIQLMRLDFDKCNKVCLNILKEWKREVDPATALEVLIRAMIKSGTDMSEVLKVLHNVG